MIQLLPRAPTRGMIIPSSLPAAPESVECGHPQTKSRSAFIQKSSLFLPRWKSLVESVQPLNPLQLGAGSAPLLFARRSGLLQTSTNLITRPTFKYSNTVSPQVEESARDGAVVPPPSNLGPGQPPPLLAVLEPVPFGHLRTKGALPVRNREGGESGEGGAEHGGMGAEEAGPGGQDSEGETSFGYYCNFI
jgi:hypothetical protein